MALLCNGILTLRVDTPVCIAHMPNARELAAALPNGIEAISDLYAAGFCAKPVFFDGLFSADPAQRSLLKQVKAAKYIEFSLLQSICTQAGRQQMGAASAQEALLHLLHTGSTRLRGGHLQTSPRKLPMQPALDPRLETPMVLQLTGDFQVYLRCAADTLAAVQEAGTLEVAEICFAVAGWQELLPGAEVVDCLQAAAAVTADTRMAGEDSRYRLICSGGKQYITPGSLAAPGDMPGCVLYQKEGQHFSVQPYTLSVSF